MSKTFRQRRGFPDGIDRHATGVFLRLSKNQVAELERLAEAAGKSLKEYLRSVKHNVGMPRRSSKPRLPDPNVMAFNIVQAVTGEPAAVQDMEPPADGKNPAAVALGKLGGAKGGAARAASLSKKRRKEIAKKAARVRWEKVNNRTQESDLLERPAIISAGFFSRHANTIQHITIWFIKILACLADSLLCGVIVYFTISGRGR